MTTISIYERHGLPGTPAMPASRSSPGCRYRGAPGPRKGAGPPWYWDLGRAARKEELS